jgi:hypothetical protein
MTANFTEKRQLSSRISAISGQKYKIDSRTVQPKPLSFCFGAIIRAPDRGAFSAVRQRRPRRRRWLGRDRPRRYRRAVAVPGPAVTVDYCDRNAGVKQDANEKGDHGDLPQVQVRCQALADAFEIGCWWIGWFYRRQERICAL